MKKAALAMLLLSLLPVLAQEAAKPDLEVETVRSEAGRLALDVEILNSEAGWFPAGSRPQDYHMGVATIEGMTRKAGFRIWAKPEASADGFGTMMRFADARPWHGKRVQLSARMKSENVDRLQLWLRVDRTDLPYPAAAPALAFYNMDDRPVRGTRDWRRYTVVLDVPDTALRLAFGFFSQGGRGVGWAEDFHVEEVGRAVPLSVMRGRDFFGFDR